MKVQLFMENGKRWSTDKLLYKSLKHKLTIITYAHVEKVLKINLNLLNIILIFYYYF